MFFLIRCVFWLSVVYSTIFSPGFHEPATLPHDQAQAVAEPPLADLAHSWISTAVSVIERGALAYCVRTDCLRPSDKVTGHFPAVRPAQQASFKAQAEADVPLPPRRPVFSLQKTTRWGPSGLEKSSRAEYVGEYSRRS
jgi:hypothetical protein